MLLAWRNNADLYIGQDVTALQAPGGKLAVAPHAAGQPLHDVLAPVQARLGQGARLRIAVSGYYCPAVPFTPPEGLRNWAETRAVMAAQASAALHIEPALLRVEFDANQQLAMAVLPAPWLAELNAWAASAKIKIVSLRPLWSMASECSLARRADSSVLVLAENDSVTTLLQDGKGQVKTITVPASRDIASGNTRPDLLPGPLKNVEGKVVRLAFNPLGALNDSRRGDAGNLPKFCGNCWSAP